MRARRLLAGLTAIAALACSQGTLPAKFLGTFEQPDAPYSPIHYTERDLASSNDQCPVQRQRLSLMIEPIYVNGRPIGFC